MPHSEVPLDEALLSVSFPEDFPFQTLSAALRNGCTVTAIKEYLQQYDPGLIKKCLEDVQSSSPVISYAVERNCAEAIETLLSYGADPQSKGTVYNILVIAFATIHAAINTTKIVKILLGSGMKPALAIIKSSQSPT